MSYARMLRGWLAVSWPLLLVLAVVAAGLGDEAGVAAFFREHRTAHPGLKAFFEIVSDWSNPVFYLVYAGFLVQGLRRGRRDLVRLALCYAAVQILVALLAVRLLKTTIGRPRPGTDGLYEPLTGDPGHHSLPSGHTTELLGAVLPLALRWRGALTALGFGLLTALTGFSRIYLGWHHPSDVFFGWLLGSAAGLGIHLLATRGAHAELS